MQSLSFKICRLCLQKSESQSDIIILNTNFTYLKLVEELLSIEIPTNSIQDYHMCSSCRNTLYDFKLFKEKCQENDVIFKNQFQIGSIPFDKTADQTTLRLELQIESNGFEQGPPDKCSQLCSKQKQLLKVPCAECGKMISKKNISAHMETHKEIRHRFPCEYCNKIYTDGNNLKKHINTHTKNTIYSCDMCSKIFDRTDSLVKHKKIMHYDERNHVCTVCGKRYALKQSLTQHLKSAHSDVKIKECKECGKKFKFNNELKMHMIKHTKERHHPCPMCSKQFSRAYYLNVHIKNVHSSIS